jgi:hypothetical protein
LSAEGTINHHFILNNEHDELLDRLQKKTGKDKHALIREAVRLALSKSLVPANYRWNKKDNRSFHVNLPVEDAATAKKSWKGKLTPLAVSGIIEMTRTENLQKVEVDDIRSLKEELARTTQRLDSLIQSFGTEQAPREITNNAAAALAVRATLRKLIVQLDYFKKGTDSDRKEFRETVDPVEVGYITSILRALFDEDGFQRWMLATDYMRKDKR